MGLGDSWHKVAVYFGIADDEDDYDEDETLAPHEELERSYQERPNVRKLNSGKGRNDYDDIFADEPRRRALGVVVPAARARPRARAARRASRSTSSSPRTSTTPSRSPTSSRSTCR